MAPRYPALAVLGTLGCDSMKVRSIGLLERARLGRTGLDQPGSALLHRALAGAIGSPRGNANRVAAGQLLAAGVLEAGSDGLQLSAYARCSLMLD